MTHVHQHSLTRGFGFFETVLAKKRARIAEKLIESGKRDGRVLDIGCGSFPYFLTATTFEEKYGVDGSINEKLFKNSPIKLKKLNVELEKLPYENNFFDVVIMLAVFEHIHPEFIDRVLKEIHRVLKKNGQLIITTPSPWSVPVLWFLSRIHLISKVEIDDHKNAYSDETIRQFIEKVGFPKEKMRQGFFEFSFNMWFVAKK